MKFRRGDIYYCNLNDAIGSEQGGIRPVLIIQNNIGNKFAPTLIVVPITSQLKRDIPTHYLIKNAPFLKSPSTVLCEQIRTVAKERLQEKLGFLSTKEMQQIDKKLCISCGLKI